ncbi:UbiX family flavin prenyltransferase [Nitrospira defluvii]|nr:UbiX family flavin prenyltransferase [Nitrospira defluvii]
MDEKDKSNFTEHSVLNYVLGISGASGAVYGVTLMEYLLEKKHRVYLILSPSARLIVREEMGMDWGNHSVETAEILSKRYAGSDLIYCDEQDMKAPVASGSVHTDGMVIAPCSMKTLAGISHGFSSSLIERAADVTLKEGRPLILIPRETPLSRVHLKNMLTASELGATLLPAMPPFYNHPKSIDDLVRFIVGRALDILGLKNDLYTRWTES